MSSGRNSASPGTLLPSTLRPCLGSDCATRRRANTPHRSHPCRRGSFGRRGLSCLWLLPVASSSLPICGFSCRGGTRPRTWRCCSFLSLLRWPSPLPWLSLQSFAAWPGRPHTKHPFPLLFANGVNIHRCRTCTAGFRLHSSTTRYFPFAGPAANRTTFQIDSGACDVRTATFMPSEKVSRHSLSYSWIRRSHSVSWSTDVFAALAA